MIFLQLCAPAGDMVPSVRGVIEIFVCSEERKTTHNVTFVGFIFAPNRAITTSPPFLPKEVALNVV